MTLFAPKRTSKRGGRARLVALPLYLAAGCSEPGPSDDTGDATTSTSTATSTTSATATTAEPATASTGDDTSTGAPTSTSDATTGGTTSDATTGDATTSDATTGDTSTTGPIGCTKNVVLMGYWPPTNEMLRPWSTDPTQNPEGWVGENWGGYGYDVHAFFPEFPPDGDPSNDKIGEDGAVGSPDYYLRVDYQATSKDFWKLVDMYQPAILLTTSRGGEIGWEIEAIEGGHGGNNDGGPAKDWASDAHGAEFFPTKSTTEARSWDGISAYRQGKTLPSQLPIDAIFDATSALGLTDVAIDQGTSGNFLSGYLGLHGLLYNELAPHNVAAGHIHVGFGLPVKDASALVEETLHTILQEHPSDMVDCP